jgi:poly(A) RNA polymerase
MQDEDSSSCRLVFHAKTSLTNGRTQVQRHMETVGDVVQLLLPGCSHVRRILQARVPIIKYHQDLTGVECDLSMTNMYVAPQYNLNICGMKSVQCMCYLNTSLWN